MEPTMAAFLDEEWESLFTSEGGADFMLQLNDCDGGLFVEAPSNFWPVSQANIENVAALGESFLCYDDHSIDYTTNFRNVSQESSYSSGSDNSVVLPELIHGFRLANEMSVFQALNDSSESVDFCVMDERNDQTSIPVIPTGIVSHIVPQREEMGNDKLGNLESKTASFADSGNELLLKRKFAKSEPQTEAEDSKFNSVENPKKEARVSRNRGQKNNKRNVQRKPKKNQKAVQVSNNDEENNAVHNGQSCSSYSSEDDSNTSQESNGGEASDNKGPALNLNGKTRASRGSATDPQSLYARRRRERINERLRILQNLVPNGTKVDISTMLDEAVHYVKFLQLQIKLLSSDDTWMYAPIVYNGLDIGLYGRIFPTP